MDKKKISVIIPVYNGEKHLRECLESVLSQTYQNFEIIVVNDGSTDKTLDICLEYKKRNKEIVLIDQLNRGVSSARNAGLDAASGDYYCFIDSDDIVVREYLEGLYNEARNDVDVAICNIVSERNELEGCFQDRCREVKKEFLSSKEYLEKYFGILGNSCCGKLFSKRCIENTRFDCSYSIGEDMLFLFEILRVAVKIVILPVNGYCYLQNETSAMNQKFTPKFMDEIYCWEELKERCYNDEILSIRARKNILISSIIVLKKLANADVEMNKRYVEICREYIKRERKSIHFLGARHRILCRVIYLNVSFFFALFRRRKLE